MATFKVRIDTSRISKVFKEEPAVLKAYLEGVMARVAKRLVDEVGKPMAQSWYGYDGEVSVYTEKIPNGYAVIAEGEQVCFLEFGTGVFANEYHPFSGQMPFTIRAGSWSETHARTWQRYLATHPNDPEGKNYPHNTENKMAMYEAYKAMSREYERLTREELGL